MLTPDKKKKKKDFDFFYTLKFFLEGCLQGRLTGYSKVKALIVIQQIDSTNDCNLLKNKRKFLHFLLNGLN